MRNLWIVTAIGTLSMLWAVPAPVWVQDQEKPPRQEEPKPEPKAEPRAEPRQQEEKPQKQEETKPQKHENKQHQEDARQQERPERNAARPAGGKSVHIPDDKFRAHFGRQHTVVIRQPVIVEGQPRFQFGGYWFVIADPWPADWSYMDDCYVDYIDGEYFLFDLLHPEVRVVLFVMM